MIINGRTMLARAHVTKVHPLADVIILMVLRELEVRICILKNEPNISLVPKSVLIAAMGVSSEAREEKGWIDMRTDRDRCIAIIKLNPHFLRAVSLFVHSHLVPFPMAVVPTYMM